MIAKTNENNNNNAENGDGEVKTDSGGIDDSCVGDSWQEAEKEAANISAYDGKNLKNASHKELSLNANIIVNILCNIIL